jgi:hypothetical protein
MLRQSILAVLLAVSSTLCAQQRDIVLPPNMETPTEPGWFRMDLASGKLTPLELVKPVMEGSRYSYKVYLPGLESTAVMPYEEKPLFAIRLTTLSGKAPTLEEERARQATKFPMRLERLVATKNGRYATKQYVPLEVIATYGDVAIFPVRGPKRETRTFVFAPQTTLSPGHYAFTAVGLLSPAPDLPSLGAVHAFTARVGAPAPIGQSAAPAVTGALAATLPPQASLAASPASGPVDQGAKAVADKFISAAKIGSEVLEARQTIRQLSWVDIHPPELIGETTIYEGMFDTDVQGIKGYKRLIEAKVRSQSSTELTVRYVLVEYKDRASGIWKVFDIRDLKGSNSSHEVEETAKGLEDTSYGGKKQANYRRYAYWLAFDGKVGMAKQAYDKAIALNDADPDPNWAKFETGRFQALQAITAQ